MNQFVDGKYTNLSRQGHDSALQRHQAMNLASGGNPLFLSVEEQLRLQRASSEQQARQNAQAVVERALLQQQEYQQQRERKQQQERKELQQLQELQELKQRHMQNFLLSKMNSDVSTQNGGADIIEIDEPRAKKRKRSISNTSIDSKPVKKKNSNETPKGKRGRKKKTHKAEVNKTMKSHRRDSLSKGIEFKQSTKMNANEKNEPANEILDIVDRSADIIDISDDLDTDDAKAEKEVNNEISTTKNSEEDKDESKEIAPSMSLETLIRAANHSELMSKLEEMQDVDLESNQDDQDDTNVEVVPAILYQPKVQFTDDDAVNFLKELKVITEQDSTAAAYFGIQDMEEIEIFPGEVTIIPKLPEEPEYDEAKANEKLRMEPKSDRDDQETSHLEHQDNVSLDVTEPTFLTTNKKDMKMIYDYQNIDSWFPSSSDIRRERRTQQGINDEMGMTLGKMELESSIQISEEMNKRLRNDVEPGVLEKLPHCRLHYESYLEQYGKAPKDQVICCQVTETFCKSTMLCCSICSTWRHAECGGHYKHYSPNLSEEIFTPICNRCYQEEPVLQRYPLAARRLSRQRSIQLRTVHAMTAIMRSYSFSKHGGTYKWPLGSVSQFHFGSHTKTIHLRHERAEKQWKEMAAKLNGTTSSKSSKSKARTRDFERLMVNLEDGGEY